MRSIALFLCFLFLSVSFSQGQIRPKFKRILKKNNLELTIPSGFIEVKALLNTEMEYQFALKHGVDTFEVRYTVFPLDDKMKEFKKNLKNPAVKIKHPNFYWVEKYNENIRSISKLQQSEIPKPFIIAADTVKEEYNADAAAVTFFPIQYSALNPEFHYGLMLVLHKNVESDVYISIFSNDSDKIESLALESFHTIRFKK